MRRIQALNLLTEQRSGGAAIETSIPQPPRIQQVAMHFPPERALRICYFAHLAA